MILYIKSCNIISVYNLCNVIYSNCAMLSFALLKQMILLTSIFKGTQPLWDAYINCRSMVRKYLTGINSSYLQISLILSPPPDTVTYEIEVKKKKECTVRYSSAGEKTGQSLAGTT